MPWNLYKTGAKACGERLSILICSGGLDNSLSLAGEIWGMPAKSSKLEFQLSEDRLWWSLVPQDFESETRRVWAKDAT